MAATLQPPPGRAAVPAAAVPAAALAVVRHGRGVRARRRRVVLLVVVATLVVAVLVALSIGDSAVGPREVLGVLLGDAQGSASFVLLRLRLPRVVVGVLVGVGFGAAGAAFQSALRNPLASPDVLGISGGASAAAVTALLLLGWDGPAVSLTALGGALLVAGLVGALAWRGGLAGQRFVLVGVAVAMLVQAALGYLLTRADVRDVSAALVWMVGSTASVSWAEIAGVAAAYAVLLPALALAARPLRLLELGDDAARGLGVRVETHRVAVLAVAVALVAVGTAVVGPIAFVAFVAGPLARRAVGTGEPVLGVAAAVGAVVVVAADVVGQHLVPGVRVPVGIVTALVGGPYLLWLLRTGGRTTRGRTDR